MQTIKQTKVLITKCGVNGLNCMGQNTMFRLGLKNQTVFSLQDIIHIIKNINEIIWKQ